MCGRFAYHAPREVFESRFGTPPPEALAPDWNITPDRDIAAVRADGACMLRWGLLPFWARTSRLNYATINAKAETVDRKPAYRAAWQKRRCLIPASGYYEWQPTADGKQPWYIRPADGGLLALAGLWERWEGRGPEAGRVIESCSIITTEANTLCAPIHHRMPVMIFPEDYARWLAEPAADLLRACADERLQAYPVSRRVNSPANNDASLIEALEH